MARAILGGVLLSGVLALGLSASSAQTASPRRQAFDAWLNEQVRASLTARRARVQALSTGADVVQYAGRVREHLVEMIGGLPDSSGPLNARLTRTQQRAGYRIEHLVYESLPGLKVTALVYVPDGPGPFPAVLGTAGHSVEGKAAPVYQHAWVSLARRGFLVLAYDPPGQGERLEYLDPATNRSRLGFGVPEHIMTGQQLLLTGSHIVRYMVQDGRRAIDYLLTRPDVDGERIAVAGNSGGGTQAALLGAFEPRLRAIVSSCYMTSWQDLWFSPGPQDAEQVLPGFIAEGLDFGDYAIAAAPRGFLVSSAIQDYFPIAGARQTFAELRTIYAKLDQPARVAMVENDATHGWTQPLREGAYRWLGSWLGQPGDAIEAPLEPETVEALNVTPTGQLQTWEGSRTIRELNALEAHALALVRGGSPREPLLRRLDRLLHLGARTSPSVVSRQAAGERRESVVIDPGTGVHLGAMIYRAADPTAPAVLLVDEGGPGRAGMAAERLQADGYTVLALEVRGGGDLGPPSASGSGAYTEAYRLAARAWLLGTSVVAWQTEDVLAGLAVLAAEVPRANSRAIHARGATTTAALFAAAFERPDRLVLEDGIVSYRDLATADAYEDASLLVVPGVLQVTDLPEVMAHVAPTAVTLRRPRTAAGGAVTREALSRHLGEMPPPNVRFELD